MAANAPSRIPQINLLCIADEYIDAFKEAMRAHPFTHSSSVKFHDCSLHSLTPQTQFDVIVSPANSYGRLDGGFDDAISRFFSPQNDYLALTHLAQGQLYKEWRGFAPPGTCTLVRMPDDWQGRSRNVWGTKHLALCPTMRVPQDVRWDKEVVYKVIWSLLCAIDKHNRHAPEEEKIRSLLMTPMATGTGYVSAKRWAHQAVLALKHFIESSENPDEWSSLEWSRIAELAQEVEETWSM